MLQYNKEFEYKGSRFNITVELNTKVEKRMNGDRWHSIRCNDMGAGNYYEKKQVIDADLESEILACQERAKASVGTIPHSESEQELLLIKLGFK